MTKLRKVTSILAVTLYATIILLPLYLALQRLVWVTGFSPFEWIDSLNNNYISQGVIEFTVIPVSYTHLRAHET